MSRLFVSPKSPFMEINVAFSPHDSLASGLQSQMQAAETKASYAAIWDSSLIFLTWWKPEW